MHHGAPALALDSRERTFSAPALGAAALDSLCGFYPRCAIVHKLSYSGPTGIGALSLE